MKKNNIVFIQEHTFTPNNIKILNESFEDGIRKIIIEMTLQSTDKNRNGRIYPPETLATIVKQLKPKALNRSLMAELDHPAPETSDTQVLQKRATTVHLKDSCALIIDIDFDGKYVTGKMEISSTPNGKLVAALIKDKVTFGFSLRSLGQVDNNVVTNPKAVTYDIVSTPSDYSASVYDVVNENMNLSRVLDEFKERKILTESVCVGDQCFTGTDSKEITKYLLENTLNKNSKLNQLRLRF